MIQKRAVFIVFVILMAAAAVLVTTSTAPETSGDAGFNTPTLTTTATSTELPTNTPTPVIGSDASSENNCTYTYDILRAYPESWGLSSIRIGSVVFSNEEVLGYLSNSPQNAHAALLQQLFTAVINQRRGADPTDIIQVISGASEWINIYPPGSDLSPAVEQQGYEYALALEQYNLGQTGPGMCTRPIETPLPSPTPTLTNTATSTGPTATYTPTITPTRAISLTGIPINPTPTPFPTLPPRPDRPTSTPAPAPTEPPPTEPPPTEPPPTEPPPTDPPPTPVPPPLR
jgi:hypothetical protein